MDVSNTTGDNTQYRTTNTIPKIGETVSPWATIKAGQVMSIPDPKCPYTIEFMVGGKIVQTLTCYEPLRRIVLMRTGSRYRVRRLKKRPPQAQSPRQRKPQQPKPQQPRRRRTVKAREGQNRRRA